MNSNRFFLVLSVALLSSILASRAAFADRLDDIRNSGTLRVAVLSEDMPFGFIDSKSNRLVGMDIDFAEQMADKLHVKLQFIPTDAPNRIPLLISDKVDLVIANLTITAERKQDISFSIPYFSSGQQFLARKGVLTSRSQLAHMTIGTDSGTTNESTIRREFPTASIATFSNLTSLLSALDSEKVQTITLDGPELASLIDEHNDKDKYEISSFSISKDYIGVGIPKNEWSLVDFVNASLLDSERSGAALKIYNRWFGPETKTPLPRNFEIGDRD
ncbi:transporter substrate-binding domain-containing protein [Paraburkholderia haematera]|jgi:ABC-type amino acid transport/signal transduction systems, periplasmic component/domain|uniref:ABC transporter glutamine-binding protein GlnH n=1 Tax=Paraburkholderia haematera TaxID=2793077 RepID=A0ABN7MIV7_9BURK|nr:transporter substrate-binding domain-containing protein [Paraburkholderia haematera]CAE6809125.1 ABC transporter glutamine-binding protein GlnH [Paraburkholderia haematera]